MNRRRAMTEGTLEGRVPPGSPEPPATENDQSGPLQKQLEENSHLKDEQVFLEVAPGNASSDGGFDRKDNYRSVRMARVDTEAETTGVENAKANRIHSVGDMSSVRKKRWGIWGGIKQDNDGK